MRRGRTSRTCVADPSVYSPGGGKEKGLGDGSGGLGSQPTREGADSVKALREVGVSVGEGVDITPFLWVERPNKDQLSVVNSPRNVRQVSAGSILNAADSGESVRSRSLENRGPVP